MKIIAEIPHPQLKITIFYINQKYIVKFERGMLEQTYKFSELNYLIPDVNTLIHCINTEFINKIIELFNNQEELYYQLTEQF
jgi:hypothetical protein